MRSHENFLERTVLVLGTEHAGARTLMRAFVDVQPDAIDDDDERAYEAQLAALSRSHAPALSLHVRRPLVDAGVDVVFKFIYVPHLDMVHAARYSESAAALVYVYDATSSSSLAALERLLDARTDRLLDGVSVRALVGNRCDVVGAERTEAAAAALGTRHAFAVVERCSAKTRDNVDATLDRLGEKLLATATREFVARESRAESALVRVYNAFSAWLVR